MSNDTQYSVSGTITNQLTKLPVAGLHVLVYDRDALKKDQFLGIGVTAQDGSWAVTFDASQFQSLLDRKPDLYFIVNDAGLELLNTKDDTIENAGVNTTGVDLQVDLSNDLLRNLIVPEPIPWVGGFKGALPKGPDGNPDISKLPVTGNLDNIPSLQRQQKVVWPEFSWVSPQGRCYQMFAPDISRLGYDKEGRVFAIICPQQGAAIPGLGSMNVEVTVTGVRGWVDEPGKELAADMSVIGQVWFAPSSHENPIVNALWNDFEKHNMQFPFNKENAIKVSTWNPKNPSEKLFPLNSGLTSEFKIPEFAKHETLSWNVAHLGVLIGAIIPTGNEKVDKFNQTILNLFNLASGDMLKDGNTLSWNVWFTRPETVNIDDWTGHAERWRDSIQADHGSPEGPGTDARFFDGSKFSPLKDIFTNDMDELMSLQKAL